VNVSDAVSVRESPFELHSGDFERPFTAVGGEVARMTIAVVGLVQAIQNAGTTTALEALATIRRRNARGNVNLQAQEPAILSRAE
jgi:hypothetical protein